MKKQKSPEIVTMSAESLEQLKTRIASGALLDGDKRVVLTILGTYFWLVDQLKSSKSTLNRLKKMFGFSTEKRSKAKSANIGSVDFSKEGTSAAQALSLNELQKVGGTLAEKK